MRRACLLRLQVKLEVVMIDRRALFPHYSGNRHMTEPSLSGLNTHTACCPPNRISSLSTDRSAGQGAQFGQVKCHPRLRHSSMPCTATNLGEVRWTCVDCYGGCFVVVEHNVKEDRKVVIGLTRDVWCSRS
jgi:hypothetical protein